MRYVIAGTHPWTVSAYERIRHEIQGEWTFVQTKTELEQVAYADPRWIFVLHWHWMVPKHIWSRIETVNMHAAPLPYGRGGNVIEHLILRGHRETVITAHRMTGEVDAGPIYGVAGRIPLTGGKADILARFVEPCVDLMRWIVAERPTPIPQERYVVRFARLSPAEYTAFWEGRT